MNPFQMVLHKDEDLVLLGAPGNQEESNADAKLGIVNLSTSPKVLLATYLEFGEPKWALRIGEAFKNLAPGEVHEVFSTALLHERLVELGHGRAAEAAQRLMMGGERIIKLVILASPTDRLLTVWLSDLDYSYEDVRLGSFALEGPVASRSISPEGNYRWL